MGFDAGIDMFRLGGVSQDLDAEKIETRINAVPVMSESYYAGASHLNCSLLDDLEPILKSNYKPPLCDIYGQMASQCL